MTSDVTLCCHHMLTMLSHNTNIRLDEITSDNNKKYKHMVDGGYFMGIPVEEFFRVDHKKAVVIGCSNYDQLREEEGFEGFQDIEESMSDIRVVKAGLRRIGFQQEDIVVVKEPDYVDVKLAMNDLMNFMLRAYKQN